VILNLIPCTQCKRPVHVTPSAAKRQSNHFCSQKCFGKSRKGKPFSGTSGSPKRKLVDGKLRCTKCKKDVPVADFYPREGGKTRVSWCVSCYRIARRDYQRRWREARLTQPAPEPVPPPPPEPPPKRNGGMVSKERQEEDLAADRARLEAWIAATDVQPRVDVWGASSASWGAALGGGF
jgi:endogenous inhibitor of DNA gyrase (YacG/DUF329 family)